MLTYTNTQLKFGALKTSKTELSCFSAAAFPHISGKSTFLDHKTCQQSKPCIVFIERVLLECGNSLCTQANRGRLLC